MSDGCAGSEPRRAGISGGAEVDHLVFEGTDVPASAVAHRCAVVTPARGCTAAVPSAVPSGGGGGGKSRYFLISLERSPASGGWCWAL